jgi:hypothetical protein
VVEDPLFDGFVLGDENEDFHLGTAYGPLVLVADYPDAAGNFE